jgi:hypothetical protein
MIKGSIECILLSIIYVNQFNTLYKVRFYTNQLEYFYSVLIAYIILFAK